MRHQSEEHPEGTAMKEDTELALIELLQMEHFGDMGGFVRHFDTLCMCRLFGEEFNQYLIQGEEGRTAAGAHKIIRDTMATSKKSKRATLKDRQRRKLQMSKKWKANRVNLSVVNIANRRGTFTG